MKAVIDQPVYVLLQADVSADHVSMTGEWNKLISFLLGGFEWGLVWLAIPAALMSFGILKISRDIGLKFGLRLAAIACISFWGVPSFGLIAYYIVQISGGADLTGDQFFGAVAAGACFAALIGTIIIIASTWKIQMHLAESQGA